MKAKFLVLVVSALVLFSVFSFAYHEKGKDERGPLSKITFIHYKKANAKPPWAGGGGGNGGGGKDKGSTCYGFLAKGAKWKTQEPYIINPTNQDGASEALIVSSTLAGVDAWETHAGDVFGNHSIDYSLAYNGNSTDGKNSMAWGAYPDSGAIAVTTVWGYFNGSPRTRELIEWDQIYNESYDWGDADVNPAKMDLGNIITHELGHSFGMADLYTADCTEETMYGYGETGETKKRTLEAGDITGITKLYG